MNYLSYTPEDFAADEFFGRWILFPDSQTESFWQDWLRSHPDKEQDVQVARRLVLALSDDTDADPSDEVIRRTWQKIAEQTQTDTPVLRHPARWRSPLSRIAAVVLLLIAATAVVYFYQFRTETYQTAYGESRRIQLPDGTVVLLNAHSTLKTKAAWASNREVWVTGEAFFQVSKKQIKSVPVKFVVHTQDLDIEVKGTQFNVNTRQQQTKVVLSEGSIQLRLANQSGPETLEMIPGDAVVFSKEKQSLIHKHLSDPNAGHSWIDSRWTLNETSLAEVSRMIEDTYGLRVVIADDSLATLKVNGSVPTGQLDDLLRTLESILDLTIEQENQQITIRSKP